VEICPARVEMQVHRVAFCLDSPAADAQRRLFLSNRPPFCPYRAPPARVRAAPSVHRTEKTADSAQMPVAPGTRRKRRRRATCGVHHARLGGGPGEEGGARQHGTARREAGAPRRVVPGLKRTLARSRKFSPICQGLRPRTPVTIRASTHDVYV
jgi:hypothetical protein